MDHPKYVLTAGELGAPAGRTAGEVLRDLDGPDLIPLSGNRTGVLPRSVKRYLGSCGVDYGFITVAHINMRGGIGKTTSTITSATRACQYGFRTCILDLDPQGSSSLAFDMVPGDEDPIFLDVWQDPDDMIPGSLRKIQDDLYILPSSLENALLDSSLLNPASQKKAVKGVCAALKKNGFDFVVIDCPPSLGIPVISTICAADLIVIPVCSDAFSFKGLELTLREVSSICETFGLKKPEIRILFNKFDRREKISSEAMERLSGQYGDYLLPSVIRTSTDFSRALALRETVFASHRKSQAREDYDRYVRCILGLDNVTVEEA